MGHIVKTISWAKWNPRIELGEDAISADAITADLRTKSNCLSFWECSDARNDEELNEIVLALAAIRVRLDKMDVTWIEKDAAAGEGIELKETEGDTPITEINKKHRDAIRLELEKICTLARLVAKSVREQSCVIRFTRREIENIIMEGINAGRLRLESLNEELRDSIEPLINAQ
jgi:hypothetical protein